MEYTERCRSGDIGEHLVAFRVMKVIGWPCRLLPIDLGVDAEIEILDDMKMVTGDVIKAQVKSVKNTGEGNKFSIYTTELHIKYWKRFCAPVLFFGVDRSTEAIYWKQITSLASYETTGESTKVTFDRKRDLLSIDAKEKWIKLSTPEIAHKLPELVGQLKEYLRSIEYEPGDWESSVEHGKIIDKAMVVRDEIRTLIAHYPWKVSGEDLHEVEKLEDTLRFRENELGRIQNELTEGM